MAHRLALETWWYQSRSKIHGCVFYIEGFKQTSWKAQNFLTTPTCLFGFESESGRFFFTNYHRSCVVIVLKLATGNLYFFHWRNVWKPRPNSEKMEGQKFGSSYWQGFCMVVVLLWSEVLGAIQNPENFWSALGEGLKLVAVWKCLLRSKSSNTRFIGVISYIIVNPMRRFSEFAIVCPFWWAWAWNDGSINWCLSWTFIHRWCLFQSRPRRWKRLPSFPRCRGGQWCPSMILGDAKFSMELSWWSLES